MLPKYRPAVERLSPPALVQLSISLQLGLSPVPGPRQMFETLSARKFTQADVVLVLVSQLDRPDLGETAKDIFRKDIALLVGKPIEVGPPPQITPLPVKSAPRETNPADARIVTRVERNPRLPTTDSFHRFKIFQVGRTIGEAIRRGVTRKDVREALTNNWVVLS